MYEPQKERSARELYWYMKVLFASSLGIQKDSKASQFASSVSKSIKCKTLIL